MGALIGFALLALIAIITFLALEKLIEFVLKNLLARTILKTIVFLMICWFVYKALPFFSSMFSP